MSSPSLRAALFLALFCAGSVPAQQIVTPGTDPIDPLHLVEYGPDRSIRDALIEDGSFYGDLGQFGIARLEAGRLASLVASGTPVQQLPNIFPGEVLVRAARSRIGMGPIHGRLVAARRAFFLTAAQPSELPAVCQGNGFHGGLEVLELDRPYRRSTQTADSTIALGGTGPNQAIATMVSEVNQSTLLAHVTTLAAIHTRRATQPGYDQAVTYVLGELANMPNLAVQTQNFLPVYGPNVIAELPGTDLANEIVMVGAHLDSTTNTVDQTMRSPGADDNASGSAAVLEIARILSTRSFRRTLRFAWWSAEENGLEGSEAYAAVAAQNGDNIVAYVNTDMNAYRAPGDSYSVDYVLNDSTTSLVNALIQSTNTYVPTLATNTGTLSGGTSDHRAFFQAGFPAAFPFEDIGNYTPFIHTSNDDVGNSANDFTLSRLITQSIVAGLADLAVPDGGGSFETFGSACATSVPAPPCGSINASGGTLTGAIRDNEYGYYVPHSGTSFVESFEIFTQSTGGNTVVNAYVYTEVAGEPAATAIASSTMTVGPAAAFYTATFDPPVTVSGDFYVALDHSAETSVISTLTSGTPGTAFWRDPPLTGNWSQSGLVDFPSYRVNCASQVSPSIGAVGVATIDQDFTLTLEGAPANAGASLVFGFNDQVLDGGVPLPLALPGAPGCAIQVSIQATFLNPANGSGSSSLLIAVPNDPLLLDSEFYNQWLILDAAANSLGVVVTNAAKSTIGE